MAKKEFKLRGKLIFSGEFTVRAHSKQEAEETLKRSVSLICNDVRSITESVSKWSVSSHGEIVLNKDYGKEVTSEQ